MNEILAQVIAGLVAIGTTVAVKFVEHYIKQRMAKRKEEAGRPHLVERADADTADGVGEAR